MPSWPDIHRWTPDYRRALIAARRLARTHGSQVVEPEHLLAAILRDDESVGKQLLCCTRGGTDDIAEPIERSLKPDHAPNAVARPRLSDATRSLLTDAWAEARQLNHAYVGTEHIVLACLRDSGSPLVTALGAAGEDPSIVLNGTLELLDLNRHVEAAPPGPPARRLGLEDFPVEFRDHPALLSLLHAESQLSDAEFDRQVAVAMARARHPKSTEELARYMVDQYVDLLRALCEPDDDQT